MASFPDARQTLRWMIRDSTSLTAGVDAFLSAALADIDWELRAGAMLAVSLFEAWHHLPLVRRLEWRNDGANSPAGADVEILRIWHDAVLHQAPVHRVPPRNHETMLLYALLNPLEGGSDTGEPLPHRAGYRFVPPAAHWLGDERPDVKWPNPIRRFTPAAGFWISESRAGEATFEAASAAAADQAKRSGRAVRLPTADEWETAARGTDARFFPWGNGYQPDALSIPSPWGLTRLMEMRGEWTIASVENPGPVLCGSSRHMGLPARVLEPPAGITAGYRFVLPDFE